MASGRASGCKTLAKSTMMPTRNIVIPDRSRPGSTTTATSIDARQGAGRNYTTAGKKIELCGEVRIATLNVGSMTGRGREIADMMERRRVNILCVQETKWKGAKAREIGGGYKLFFYGLDGKRNGVGIILDPNHKQSVIEVERVSDRIIRMRVEVCGTITNIVSAYAPQTGCPKDEKEEFWDSLDDTIRKIKKEERLFIGADLNGHVGKGNDGVEKWVGGHGLGTRNEAGTEIINFAMRGDMAIVNTFFNKRDSHMITYASGGRNTQIDYILCRQKHVKEVRDCKTVPGESVVSQHRVVVGTVRFGTARKREQKSTPKTRWWRLKEDVHREAFVERVIGKLGPKFPNDWTETSRAIREAAKETLGVSSGRRKADKETWWWNESVQQALKKKKAAKSSWDEEQTETARQAYKIAKKDAKKVVAMAKSEVYQTLYAHLETEEGQKNVFRIAKQRQRESEDIHHVKMIKDHNGTVLTKESEIRDRWKNYYSKLMNEENPRERRVSEQQIVENEVNPISKEETWKAICKMKSGKAVGPDGIPAEAWKALGDVGSDFLCGLFNSMLENSTMPDEWRESIMVPIYKKKGDIQECGNYRGIKLISHTMKIWERIINDRIRREVNISDEQFGFMPGKGTTDAIFALRRVIEKHREKERELHCIFIDLEKAYDRVPREEVWFCLREKGVSERYIQLVKDMYQNSRTVVRTAVGNTEPFCVNVGLHQGSALSPILFAVVIDVLTDHTRRKAPWNLMFADDVALLNKTREEAEVELEKWRNALERRGLRISRTKTEYLCVGESTQNQAIKMGTEEIPETTTFKYLGSTVQGDGGCDYEVKKRIQAGWNNWRKVTGVMCDKRAPARLKGKLYKTVVRPAMLYGLETVALTKKQEAELEVNEMRMLRWSLGWTRKDRIRNDKIRMLTGVRKISSKTREGRLRWYGHVKRRDEGYVGKEVLEMEVQGKRKRGRPKRRWIDTIKTDMREVGLEEEDALDRRAWKCGIHYGNPATCGTS